MGAAASAVKGTLTAPQRDSLASRTSSDNGQEASLQAAEQGRSDGNDSSSSRSPKGIPVTTPEQKLNMIGPSRRVLNMLETKQAASIDAYINDELTPTENAANIIDLILKENVRRYDAKTKAGLNYALGVLKLGSGMASAAPHGFQAITTGSISAHVDSEMQDWLRANFTPEAHNVKSSVDAKTRFRKAGMGVFAADAILKGMKGDGKVHFPELPIEVPQEEEVRIKAKLEGIDRWNWNIFELEEILEITSWRILMDWGLPEKFHIPPRSLQKFLSFVQSNYVSTEYHNATHASDVLQSVHYMLKTAGASKYLSDVQILAMLLGAICHDLGHDGYNNLYHKNKITERALDFNDQSIQENFHAKTLFFQLHQSPELNIFQNFNENQQKEMRRMIIDLILATDMTKHFTMLTDLKNEINRRGTKPESWSESQDLLMNAILHTCDISNPAKPRPLCENWTERVLAEFFKQGDREKEAGLPISPQCNRDTTTRSASQMGFIHFIVEPSWQAIGQLFPEVEREVLPTIAANMKFWVSVAENTEGVQVSEAFKGRADAKEKEEKEKEIEKETEKDKEKGAAPEPAIQQTVPVTKLPPVMVSSTRRASAMS